MRLADVPLAQVVELRTMPENPSLQRRLRAMGVQPGRRLVVIRRGWPGGILHLRMGLQEFMLRRRDAAQMDTRPLSPDPDAAHPDRQ
jgi:ferrous iron transport protein A